MQVWLYPPTHGSGLGEQFRQTATALRAEGVDWQLAGGGRAPSPEAGALAHLFSLPDVYTSLQNFLQARRAAMRVVVSPIYWNPTRFYAEGLPRAEAEALASSESVRTAAAVRDATLRAERALQQFIFRHADLLIALSPSEGNMLARDFGVDPARIAVAPNGVDPIYSNARPDAFVARYGLRDFVLCAARADARKNQLSLIRALRGQGLALVLAGGSVALPYLEMCRREAGAKVHFLPALPREELASAYAAAKVHALVSWYDCAPLAALEAGAAGCNLVLTTESGARDYVGEAGWYCNPGALDSIRRAVFEAYNAARTDSLREHILTNYSWANAARATRAAYEHALAFDPPRGDEYQADLENATLALATLVPLLEQSRAQLWHEKSEAQNLVQQYARGRLMRVLKALTRFRQPRS